MSTAMKFPAKKKRFFYPISRCKTNWSCKHAILPAPCLSWITAETSKSSSPPPLNPSSHLNHQHATQRFILAYLKQIMPNHYTILQITISDTPTPTQPPKSPTQRFILAYYRQIMPTHHTDLQITISHTVSGQNPIGIYIIGFALI